MDIEEVTVLLDKVNEAREAGWKGIIDASIEEGKNFFTPNPAMLMKELEHFVKRVKTVMGEFSPHWHQDMNSRIDALAGEVNDIYHASQRRK